VLRVLLVPVLVVLLLRQTSTAAYVAAALFVIGAATDSLDGYLARRYGTKTRTGQWLDPLADKVFVATPVILLSILGRFPAWAAAIIVLREAAVVVLRAFLGTRGRAMPASFAAKVKTTMQLFAITLYILPLTSGADGFKLFVLSIALALTISTGIQYAIAAGAWLKSEERTARRRPAA
jgi:CDP-diacylglycerol--glycerol-3-phosphate 3-phosphatidyltransferase